MKTMDDFFAANRISKSFNREKSISEILGEKSSKIVNFERGHIDKIDDNGNFIGNAGEEILEYIESKIKANVREHELINKKFTSLGISNYIDNSDDDIFWENLKK